MAGARKKRGRVSRWFERVALGAIMGGVAFVVERRLLKALRKRGEADTAAGSNDAELAAAPEQVQE